jgi:hypothetical protein
MSNFDGNHGSLVNCHSDDKDPSAKAPRPKRYLALTVFLLGVLCLSLTYSEPGPSQDNALSTIRSKSVSVQGHPNHQCRFYMAESGIPNGGLGMFSGVGLFQGDSVGFPDICIFVSEPPKKLGHMGSHTWGWASFFGQYEGVHRNRAACEGFASMFNGMPLTHVNAKPVGPVHTTTAGLDRATQPGAGAITHHYGMHAVALDVIPAGAELTVDYGDYRK